MKGLLVILTPLFLFAFLPGCVTTQPTTIQTQETATGFPQVVPEQPDVFTELMHLIENHFWDTGQINHQALLKGAVAGLEPDLRRRGGNISYQDDHVAISLSGQTKTISLASVTTIPELIHAFADLYRVLLRAHKTINWEYPAIEGLLKNLDRHSHFIAPPEFREMQQETKGSFGGIGLRLGIDEGEMVIVEATKGAPASEADLRPGDRLLQIDGHAMKGLTLQEAVRRLRGPVGSRIVLSILRPGSVQPKDVSLYRAKIEVKTVESHLLDGRIGYIKLQGFHATTSQETERALRQLSQQEINGLILDLRNNPGGLLKQAVKVCSLFLDDGLLIVSTANHTQNQSERFEADPGGQYRHYPLIVLVNGGSAAGAEIVAGALQQHKRATIVGTKSYGQGSVQTVFALRDGSGLRLATTYFFMPSGRNIDGVGLTPDIEIQNVGKEDRQMKLAHEIMKKELEGKALGAI